MILSGSESKKENFQRPIETIVPKDNTKNRGRPYGGYVKSYHLGRLDSDLRSIYQSTGLTQCSHDLELNDCKLKPNLQSVRPKHYYWQSIQ